MYSKVPIVSSLDTPMDLFEESCSNFSYHQHESPIEPRPLEWAALCLMLYQQPRYTIASLKERECGDRRRQITTVFCAGPHKRHGKSNRTLLNQDADPLMKKQEGRPQLV